MAAFRATDIHHRSSENTLPTNFVYDRSKRTFSFGLYDIEFATHTKLQYHTLRSKVLTNRRPVIVTD